MGLWEVLPCVRKNNGHRTISISNLQFTEISVVILPTKYDKEIFIGSVYKSPTKLLTTNYLDIITSISDQYITAGDFKAKHKFCNSVAPNPAGLKLHKYCRRHDIEVSAPLEQTFYRSTCIGKTSSILDIVLSKNVNVSSHILALDEVPVEFQIYVHSPFSVNF